MLTLLSPSKSTTNQKPPFKFAQTEPLFGRQTEQIIRYLRSLNKRELADVLQISQQLATLNYQRYKNWHETETKSAVWLYSGDVYNGLDAFSMGKKSVSYAQNHVLIISGLYGLVRPLDGVRPYRLEMKFLLKGPWGGSLYEVWQDKIAEYIKNRGEETILMCASPEYSKAVTAALPKSIRIVKPRFMQETDSSMKEKGLFAKYARGSLARWVIDNRVDKPTELKNYDKDGFLYSAELSSENEIVYIVPKNFTLKGRFTKK
jgi:cytoplasmic iron level regulating protein YaaA (DUF328/UPF0246 family)